MNESQQKSLFLFAKLKGGLAGHRVVLGVQALDNLALKKPGISNAVEYDPNHELLGEEWFYVSMTLDDRAGMLGPYLSAIEEASELQQVSDAEYRMVECLYTNHESGAISFYKIGKREQVESNRAISFDAVGATSSVVFNQLIMPESPVAFFDGGSRLYFRNFTAARPLFKGLQYFFYEATSEQKESFLDSSIFDIDDVDAINVSPAMLKRIEAISNDPKLDLEDTAVRSAIAEYARDFRSRESGVQTDGNGRITINNTADLNAAIGLLSQRYFTSVLTGEKMQASSVKRAKK